MSPHVSRRSQTCGRSCPVTGWGRGQPSVHFGATGWLRFGWDRRADTATANGHRACDQAAIRSARPILWPLTSCSTKNQARNTRSVQAAAADTCGRRRTGTVRPDVSGYFQANAGHIASETKAAAAAAVCAEEEGSPAGNGNAATSRVANPPSPRTSLPAVLAQPSALAVPRYERPTPTKAPVISHRWGVSRAARSLRAHNGVKMHRLHACSEGPAADEQEWRGNG